MKNRLLVVFLILVLRFVLGWIDTAKFKQNSQIIVSGNINNLYQNNTNCIIEMGRFWIDYRSDCQFSRRDKIRITGSISKGVIDKILGRLWLDSAKIEEISGDTPGDKSSASNQGLIQVIREKSMFVYSSSLPEPESGLVAGIVLGYKKDIGQSFYDMMVKSGTVHIAVASGYNIMMVGGTALSLCLWLMKRRWASLVSTVLMLFYAVEAGGEPPVIRAVIMGAVVFIGAVIGRKVLSWWILLVTGWLMVLWEPLLLVNVSFQLTMAASVGLMIGEPVLTKFLNRRLGKMTEYLSGIGVTSSIATMVTTMPFIWWHFGRVSWIGILSNSLILPFVPVLMILGAGMQLWPELFSWPVYVVAHWMVGVIRFFGS